MGVGHDRVGFVVPPNYQNDTNLDGLARITMRVPDGGKLEVTIEMSRGDRATETRDLEPGKDFPDRLPPEKFTLKRKTEKGTGPTIAAAVEVRDVEGQPRRLTS